MKSVQIRIPYYLHEIIEIEHKRTNMPKGVILQLMLSGKIPYLKTTNESYK